MTMIEAVKTCFGKYFVFSGRATRSEYWWFFLFVILVSVALAFVDGGGSGILNGLFQLAVIVPMLAAGWRRLHDTGRPGWYLLLPVGLNVLVFIAMFTGIFAFSAIEAQSADPDNLREPATLIGAGGMAIVGVAQLLLAILLIWWLSRPSDPNANQFGDPV